MSHEYAALLKAHRDIPVLSTGINNTVTQDSTFPTKEHPSLLTHTGKTVNMLHRAKNRYSGIEIECLGNSIVIRLEGVQGQTWMAES